MRLDWESGLRDKWTHPGQAGWLEPRRTPCLHSSKCSFINDDVVISAFILCKLTVTLSNQLKMKDVYFGAESFVWTHREGAINQKVSVGKERKKWEAGQSIPGDGSRSIIDALGGRRKIVAFAQNIYESLEFTISRTSLFFYTNHVGKQSFVKFVTVTQKIWTCNTYEKHPQSIFLSL